MTKRILYSKTKHVYQFTDEERKKINDFFTELTGLTNITKIIIEPQGMYITTLEIADKPMKFYMEHKTSEAAND